MRRRSLCDKERITIGIMIMQMKIKIKIMTRKKYCALYNSRILLEFFKISLIYEFYTLKIYKFQLINVSAIFSTSAILFATII